MERLENAIRLLNQNYYSYNTGYLTMNFCDEVNFEEYERLKDIFYNLDIGYFESSDNIIAVVVEDYLKNKQKIEENYPELEWLTKLIEKANQLGFKHFSIVLTY